MVFLTMSIITVNFICLFVPRRFSWIEIVTTTLAGLYFEDLTNVFLDLKYDLYGYYNKGGDWATLIIIFGIYPQLIAIIAGIFYYNGWKWWYSALAYPLIIPILAYNLKFIRWVVSKSSTI